MSYTNRTSAHYHWRAKSEVSTKMILINKTLASREIDCYKRNSGKKIHVTYTRKRKKVQNRNSIPHKLSSNETKHKIKVTHDYFVQKGDKMKSITHINNFGLLNRYVTNWKTIYPSGQHSNCFKNLNYPVILKIPSLKVKERTTWKHTFPGLIRDQRCPL